MSHTQGPWGIRFGGLKDDDEGFCIDSTITGDVVAERWPCTTTKEDRAELCANARLIAAAPELLELVKKCRGYAAFSGIGTREIDALIERIEGKPNESEAAT